MHPLVKTAISLYLPKMSQSFNEETVDLFLDQIKGLTNYIEVGNVTDSN